MRLLTIVAARTIAFHFQTRRNHRELTLPFLFHPDGFRFMSASTSTTIPPPARKPWRGLPLQPASINCVMRLRKWGQGASGYGYRFASGYGRMIIGRTIRSGVAAVDHEDPRFERFETAFWPRAHFAVVHYFVPRTDAGTPIPAFSRFAGLYGAAFIAKEWYPAIRANTTHALLRGTTALSSGLGWNVLKEFWLDIKNAVHPHRP